MLSQVLTTWEPRPSTQSSYIVHSLQKHYSKMIEYVSYRGISIPKSKCCLIVFPFSYSFVVVPPVNFFLFVSSSNRSQTNTSHTSSSSSSSATQFVRITTDPSQSLQRGRVRPPGGIVRRAALRWFDRAECVLCRQ